MQHTSRKECRESEALSAGMIGRSEPFRRALHLIRKLATCDVTALIEGETGTGKELAAHAIHYLGRRRDFPFIPVNCGALPDSLMENELFGHARGAFTDARDATSGLIADADGGTLFLDELEALTHRAQVTLLRFLQDGVYRPLGARRTVQANVRVIGASNQDLRELVREGRFREDLLYRLRIMRVKMPALRERPEDIPLLTQHFLDKFSAQYCGIERCIPAEVMDVLCAYRWPGNVRELENVIHRAMLASDGREISCEDTDLNFTGACPATLAQVPPRKDFASGFNIAKARVVEQFERAYVTWAMENCRGNVSAAARRSGKERRAFGRLVKKYGIVTRTARTRTGDAPTGLAATTG
jgi:DNA-binding NtrC family response regulator